MYQHWRILLLFLELVVFERIRSFIYPFLFPQLLIIALKRRYEGKKDIPKWKELMITINRKTLVVCKICHSLIHSGKYDRMKLTKV